MDDVVSRKEFASLEKKVNEQTRVLFAIETTLSTIVGLLKPLLPKEKFCQDEQKEEYENKKRKFDESLEKTQEAKKLQQAKELQQTKELQQAKRAKELQQAKELQKVNDLQQAKEAKELQQQKEVIVIDHEFQLGQFLLVAYTDENDTHKKAGVVKVIALETDGSFEGQFYVLKNMNQKRTRTTRTWKYCTV